MEPIAYGAAGLTPDEFGRLTPREFVALAAARGEQRDEDRAFLASLVLPLIQLGAKRTITLDTFLGPAYTAWRLVRAQRRATRALDEKG